MENCFPKNEKLCGKERIKRFYTEAQKMTVWPLRVSYRPAEDTRVLIWAPKSLFKHAVDRNRLRRLMREAWRLNHKDLQKHYWIAFNYIDKNEQPLAVIEKAMRRACAKLK